MKKRKLTQKAFAKSIGVSARTVRRWEKGECKPSKLAIEAIHREARRIRRKR